MCGFLFLPYVYLVLLLGLTLASQNELGSIYSSSVFCKSLYNMNIIFSLSVWWNSPV